MGDTITTSNRSLKNPLSGCAWALSVSGYLFVGSPEIAPLKHNAVAVDRQIAVGTWATVSSLYFDPLMKRSYNGNPISTVKGGVYTAV